MRFDDINWFDIRSYLQKDDRLMFVLGSCEQHAYLSLLTDVKIPLALADAASQQTGVLVAPSLNFGSSPYFRDFPGTLSLRAATLMDLTEDLVLSAHHQGFKRVLVLNGHGGNEPARLRLYELANENPDLQLTWYCWWQSHSVEDIAQKYGLKPAHANWLEAFPFVRVSDMPDGEEKTPLHVPGLLGAAQARRIYGDGSFGGPYQAAEEVYKALFAAALADVLHLLKFE